MKHNHLIIITLATALIFALLFNGLSIGLNLFIFEMIVIPMMLYIFRPIKFNYLSITILAGLIASTFLIVFIHTAWVIFVNIILMLSFSGMVMYSKSRSFFHLFLESVIRFFGAQFAPLKKNPDAKSKKHVTLRKVVYFGVIPLIILLLFIILYSSASSVFSKQFSVVVNTLNNIIKHIDFQFVGYFILGLIFCNSLFMKTNSIGIYDHDLIGNDTLTRIRVKNYLPFRNTGLKTEATAGVIILSMLNVLILYFNILDLTNVWVGFKWDGDFLKEFVHEGTWILVLSVFISAGIALYFFKGNLNFYSKNLWLKRLTIIWLAQNLLMCISVVIRNYWYINYFGLAYKRIAVLFFLLLTIIGLVSIIIKIVKKKSTYNLLKINSFALLLVLIFTMFFNWDVLIAKYNFRHADRSLIEYRFMSFLNDSSLPYLLKTDEEMAEIEQLQNDNLPLDIHAAYLWDTARYQEEMAIRKEAFLKKYSEQKLLEWNYADYRTWKKVNF